MTSKLINILGLVFDIAGASIMFFHTPHPSDTSSIGTTEDFLNDLARERVEKRRVRLGMFLLIIGFLFQIVATLTPG